MFVFLLNVGTVPTMLYVCISIVCWNCSDGVVCLFFYCMKEQFRRCGMFVFYCMLELFRRCGMFVFLLNAGTVPTV